MSVDTSRNNNELTDFNESIPSYDDIWKTMHVEQKLEDAYAKLMTSHSKISTVKNSFTKLTLGHIRTVEKWQRDVTFDEASEAIQELEKINEQTRCTCDVILAKRNFGRAKALLKQVTESSENEDRLITQRNGLYKCLSDVRFCASDYVMRLSIQLNELGDELEKSLIAYQRREEEIFREAEHTLKAHIIEHFRNYRLNQLQQIQRRIREKHEEDINEILFEYRAENEKRAQEYETIGLLKTEVSKLRIELSAQPLIRHRKIVMLEDEMLEKQTTATLLESKLARILELQEKRKVERKNRLAVID